MLSTFIIGASKKDISVLKKILQNNLVNIIEPFYESGKSFLEALKDSIKKCDFIISIIDSKTTQNDFFEIGYACGNNKTMLNIVDPDFNPPLNIAQFMYINANLNDYNALEFNISIFIDKLKTHKNKKNTSVSQYKEKHKKNFNEKIIINDLNNFSTEEQVIAYLHNLLLNVEGIDAVYEYNNFNNIVDLAIWINDIQKFLQGPVLIEYKNNIDFSKENIKASLNKFQNLLYNNNSSIGLLITKDNIANNLKNKYLYPILLISLNEFISLIANNTLSKTIIEYRNKSIHFGGPNA